MKTRLTRLGATARMYGLGLCAAAALAACSTQTATDNRPPEEIVKQRAAERWDALLAADYTKAYGYLAPTVRTVKSLEGYKLGLRVVDGKDSPWKKYEIRQVSCQEQAQSCKATVAIEAILSVPKFAGMTATAEAEEEWILQDGQWYYYMR